MRNQKQTARALAALGHETRLAVFRLLVRAGEAGLNAGDIAAHMEMPASTLAHHLSTLANAGLVLQRRRGREIVSRADYAAMRATVSFLTAECCTGVKPPRPPRRRAA